MQAAVKQHYSLGKVLASLIAGLEKIGRTPDTALPQDLDAADQFHLGGKESAMRLLGHLDIKETDVVLDIGCGLGGPARAAALTFGCQVKGVDLTPELVAAGNAINAWKRINLSHKVKLETADALFLPHINDASIDKAYMLHVAMNIADKTALARSLFRVLKPGGRFALFDLMRGDSRLPLVFPLPFASSEQDCAVAPSSHYRTAMTQAGFELAHHHDRTAYCDNVLVTARDRARRRSALAVDQSGTPLSLAVVMGPDAGLKLTNLHTLLRSGALVAVEQAWRKPS